MDIAEAFRALTEQRHCVIRLLDFRCVYSRHGNAELVRLASGLVETLRTERERANQVDTLGVEQLEAERDALTLRFDVFPLRRQ